MLLVHTRPKNLALVGDRGDVCDGGYCADGGGVGGSDDDRKRDGGDGGGRLVLIANITI